MTEEVVISCKREFSKNLKLIFHARVLGNFGIMLFFSLNIFFSSFSEFLTQVFSKNNFPNDPIYFHLLRIMNELWVTWNAGEGKGTPALKNGVHLVKGHTDDSHASDWNGFD